ncbi:hypothetical protein [Candidatus Coxiella mudrowiae]|uniref:hypothetical protein n=1 Tax=Candidatus Coxiella mudrowiae TaxID=2054173 RepID=UPI001FD0DA1A|nr:hypothetical protein [Candidatus Coxiella mudrowiae]
MLVLKVINYLLVMEVKIIPYYNAVLGLLLTVKDSSLELETENPGRWFFCVKCGSS